MVESEIQNDVEQETKRNTEERIERGSHFQNKECTKSQITEVTDSNCAKKFQCTLMKIQKLASRQRSHPVTFNLPITGDDNCIGASERDSAVTSIKSMQKFYNYGSDTLAAAVSYLDTFLSKVKVKRRYLSCIATAAFFLSTKMNEESEYHPSASDLAALHRHSWKASDLKRMEKVILEKLDWTLYPAVTCLAFLELIHAMLCLLNPSVNETFLSTLIKQSEILINYTYCAKYRPSTLAICITYLCLKEAGLSTTSINYLMLHIQGICKLSDSEVLDCQCAISQQLDLYNTQPTHHPLCLPLPKLIPRPNMVTRPSYYCPTDLPVIEEVPYSLESREEAEISSYQGMIAYPVCPVGPYGVVLQSYVKTNQIVCLLPDTSYSGAFGAVYGSVQ